MCRSLELRLDDIQAIPPCGTSGSCRSGLPEKLVAGRQADYFGYFFNFGKFTPGDAAHFVKLTPPLHSFTQSLKCTARFLPMHNSMRATRAQ